MGLNEHQPFQSGCTQFHTCESVRAPIDFNDATPRFRLSHLDESWLHKMCPKLVDFIGRYGNTNHLGEDILVIGFILAGCD